MTRAREALTGNCTLALCKGERLYTSDRRGVGALLALVEEKESLQGFSAADKVVGKGAAFLYLLLGVTHLYAKVISQSALEVLQEAGVAVIYDTLAPRIVNRRGDGFCPIESAVLTCTDPHEALICIKERLKEL